MHAASIGAASSYLVSAALAGAALGCAGAGHPPRDATTASHAAQGKSDFPAHVYRLDFTVVRGEPGREPDRERFTMSVPERSHGDVMIGRNVPVAATGAPGTTAARTDVGLRLGADCETSGDDVLVRVWLDASDVEAGTAGPSVSLHKAESRGAVVVKPGEPALVARLDDGQRPYEVSVTATRLR